MKSKNNLENYHSLFTRFTIKHSKAFSLVYEENFDLKKISILRAFIEYIDQAVLTINSVAILNTLTTYHSITADFVDYFYKNLTQKLKSRKTIRKFRRENKR